ncbi:DUF1361 domain-containing protein [uncultured Friedmanniella sp.]|uniref:DUF1361 domain-containing protein n=1 Tax=uncultured Friedmanniella sp. TaxID=335381 RepID=UPI0035CAAEDE
MPATVTTPEVGRRLGSWWAWLTLALALASLASIGLLEVRVDRVGKPTFLFLVWNLALAWVPFLLALGVAAVHRVRGPRPLLAVLGLGWLVFLPNAPYILTDFVHLRSRVGAPLWFDALLIGTFAATGLALGLASLLVVHHVVEARAGRVAGWVVAVTSLLLSVVGTYLGRFPRFNSWNVITDPDGLVSVALRRIGDPFGNPFLLRYAGAMSVLLLTSYLVAWLVARPLLRPVRAARVRG